MSNPIRNHIRSNIWGILALYVALGGTAIASHPGGQNTINSADIVDGQVKVADVGEAAVASHELKNNSILPGDVAPNSLTSARIADGTLTSADVQNNALTPNDLAPNSIPTGRILDETITGTDVKNNALKGDDVDEASLSGALIPGITTSGLVKSSGVVRADVDEGDNGEGDVTSQPLLSSGPFTIIGVCSTFRGANTSSVRLTSSAANWSIDSDADLGDNLTDATGGGVNLASQSGIESPAEKALDAGDYAAVAPSKLLSGEAVAGVNIMGSDCAWAVTGIG